MSSALVFAFSLAFLTSHVVICQEYEDTDSSYTDTDPSYGGGDYYGPPHETDSYKPDPSYPPHHNDNNYGSYGKNNVNCGPLPGIKNGKVEIVPDTKKASIAMYICDEGFLLYGKGRRVCTRGSYGGVWSGKAPKCIPVDCGPLPNIDNGRIILTGTGYRDTATYLCKLGTNLIGDRSRKCDENGEWSGDAPMCKKITCPELSPPENGKLFVTGRIPSDIAIYSCKYGFYSDGQKRRECQRSGEWSGTDPSCKKIEPIIKNPPPPPTYTPTYSSHEEPLPTYPREEEPSDSYHDGYEADDEYYEKDSAPYHHGNDIHY